MPRLLKAAEDRTTLEPEGRAKKGKAHRRPGEDVEAETKIVGCLRGKTGKVRRGSNALKLVVVMMTHVAVGTRSLEKKGAVLSSVRGVVLSYPEGVGRA